MRSNEDIEFLCEKYKNLVYKVMNDKFKAIKLSSSEVENELYSEGMIGLFSAARVFDESKGFKFSTLAYKAIYFRMIKFVKRELPKQNRLNESCILENEVTDGIRFMDNLKSEDYFIEVEINQLIKNLMEYLNEEQIKILNLRMVGYSQNEIGIALGVGQVYVSRQCIRIGEIIKCISNNTEYTNKRIEERKLRQKRINEINELRKYKDLNTKKIGEILGLTPVTVRRIEKQGKAS